MKSAIKVFPIGILGALCLWVPLQERAEEKPRTFSVWATSCSHVPADIARGRESLGDAIRQSEGSNGFDWDVMIDAGDLSASQFPPIDEDGEELQIQYRALTKHRREQIYNVQGNHDAPYWDHGAGSWFRKWGDPMGENTELSGVDTKRRPFPVEGSWERYKFQAGNILFLMLSDRNDTPSPVGRGHSSEKNKGGYPPGAVTRETFNWWKKQVLENQDKIIVTMHHHALRDTTTASGNGEGNPRYHGASGGAAGSSYLYFMIENDDPENFKFTPDAHAFEDFLADFESENGRGAIDFWIGGHTHVKGPTDDFGGKTITETKWGVNFLQSAALTRHHAGGNPLSRLLTFSEGADEVAVRTYLHDTSFENNPVGFFEPATKTLKLRHAFQTPVAIEAMAPFPAEVKTFERKIPEKKKRSARSSNKKPRSFFVTRSMAHEKLIPFLEEARPDIVQIGQYGPMFHGYADDPKSKGTPMNLPITGERELLKFQKELNQKIHDLGLKSVGHFRLVKAYGNWEDQSGFVDYYKNRWSENILGPKPHNDLRELLQRDATGVPIQVSRYEQSQIPFCLSSPHARKMLKQMLKVAVDHGIDGVITTYNYHLECACPFCQDEFRTWLSENISADDIKEKLGITDLTSHKFESIPAKISGFPDSEEATEMDWLAMRWAAENFKKHYDDIFIEYGRTLKPDLIISQWNHLGHVGAGEERTFLSAEKWGKDEDYFWESGGASFVGKNLNLAERKAGDAWLSCLVLRELGDQKPFVMGKYDGMRMAASMAEGYATGGLGMGRYMRFEDPDGYETLSRYIKFRHENESLFVMRKSIASVALMMPRQSAIAGDPKPLDKFREIGQSLLEKQILFDILVDEKLNDKRLKNYKGLIVPEGTKLTETQQKTIQSFSENGGSILEPENETAISTICPLTIKAPWTVRVSAYERHNRTRNIHLVNYDRDEGETKEERKALPGNERPRSVEGISIKMKTKQPIQSVRLFRPDIKRPIDLTFETEKSGISFVVPKLLVYGIVEIQPK